MKPLFTPEELAELAAFDAEIDADDQLTIEEIRAADRRDAFAREQTQDPTQAERREKRREQEVQNRDKLRQKSREYYRNNTEKCKEYTRRWRARNRDRVNALARGYYNKGKEKKKTMTRSDRYDCLDCPHMWESNKGGERLNSISGPSRKATPYTYYCRHTGLCRKIAHKADYTGLVPKWCPRLAENGGHE